MMKNRVNSSSLHYSSKSRSKSAKMNVRQREQSRQRLIAQTLPSTSKKAQLGHGIIWLYRFVLIVLVAIAYVLIVFNLLYLKYDVRQAETALLAKRAVNCLTDEGIAISNNFENEALKQCVGFKNLDQNQINEYYISASLKYGDFSGKVETGNVDLIELCGLKGNVPKCLSQSYYILVQKDNKMERAKLDLNVAVLKVAPEYWNV